LDKQIDADAAFAHLEELVEGLASIQEKDGLLARAREARELIALRDKARVYEEEIEGYRSAYKQAIRDARKAADADDKDLEGRSLVLVRAYNEMEQSRLAIMQHAQDDVRRALKSGTLTLEDPLEEIALNDEEYDSLKNEIEAFQTDYQKTYELCTELEGL
jgi:hypothetical protein